MDGIAALKKNGLSGRRGGTRTHDPLLRRQMLYPPELRAHHADSFILDDLGAGCSRRISLFGSERKFVQVALSRVPRLHHLIFRHVAPWILLSGANVCAVAGSPADGNGRKSPSIQQFPPEEMLPLDERGPDPDALPPPVDIESASVRNGSNSPVIAREQARKNGL